MNLATLSLNELYRPIADDLEAVLRVFDEEVLSDLPFVNDLSATVRSYRGKMLRPALVLLAGRACGNVTPGHHTLAAVVELVHMATLVHDDVLDEASERRKQPTIAALTGNTQAVLLGDFLISHAFHLCSSLNSQEASRLIGATTNTVCEGEMLQNHQRGNFELSEAGYLDIIRRKTAVLTASCCRLGAWQAGAPDEVVEALEAYGLAAGIAFQVVDDVLDVVGDKEKVGKTLGLDFDLGKATLPTIHCLAHADEHIRRPLTQALRQGWHERADQVREWLTTTDSIEYALATADRYVQDALQSLEALPPSEARTSLTALAEFIVRRQF